MRRAKNRKGIFVVLFGILFMSLMAAAAMSIDFARVWAMRNELQTSADAAALAGAVQLGIAGENSDDEVRAEANRLGTGNLAMGAVPVINEVTLGQWEDALAPNGFSVATPYNAVRIEVSHATRGLIMGALGITAPTVHARAIAWADAPVSNTNCIRPWAIPYEVLMAKINPQRTDDPSISGDPFSRANLTRPFNQTLDMPILKNASVDDRTFSLKLGQNTSNANDNSPKVLEGTTVNGQPGNFQAVVLPKKWDFKTQSATDPPPQPGGNAYKDAIMGKNCYTLAVGDSLLTETGDKTQPTITAADKSSPQTAPYGVCESIVDAAQGQNVDLSIHGNCMNASGGVGVDVKAAFYYCPSSCQGRSTVAVQLLGSFTLKKIYPDNDPGGGPNNTPRWDMSQIVGTFNPIEDSGPVGGAASLLRKVILVK